MEELQSARKKVVALLGEVNDVEDAVVRAERRHNGKCYAVTYFDLADNVVGRAKELQAFQERVLGDDFFAAQGDLRWNKYLYIVAGPKSLSHDDFEKAKSEIESDKDFARKRVVLEADLEALLGTAKYFTPEAASKEFNVVGEWEKRLAVADLDELLDRPIRKDVVERIGTRSAKRGPIADKTLTLDPRDASMSREWLASISINRFRPIHDGKSYSFGQVNLIVGPNGTGKTSLLEAIEYFYCGHNRRPGNFGDPRISGALTGDPASLPASTESGRIRARCFHWYNREERFAKSILSAFTRYNFLDTDAAFRLSTELEPSEIPDDLSRLLVGPDASTIWDYLSKITPEVETAYERALLRVDDSRQKLELANKELKDLQQRPSNSKALTEAFRTALSELRWKAPRAKTPLANADEANGLQEVLGHIQAVLGAGSAAASLNAISARAQELDSALNRARALDNERTRYAQEAKRLAEQALAQEHASQMLDRWFTYVNSGFTASFSRVASAKAAADVALGRLGVYANGDVPMVPEQFASITLASAMQWANLNVRSAVALVTELEKLSDHFGKAAAARAQAARQLRTAAQASFDAGHPMDECPICRAKYLPQELAAFVEKVTDALEQPSELTDIIAQLAAAKRSLKDAEGWIAFFQYLEKIAYTINLSSDAVCGAIPSTLSALRTELAAANSELALAREEWNRLASSGLTTNEHNRLRDVILAILPPQHSDANGTAIAEARATHLEAATTLRKQEAEYLELCNQISKQLAEISASAISEGWNTRGSENEGVQSLIIMQAEIASLQSRVSAMQRLMEVEPTAALSALSVGVVSSSRLHSEALEAAQIESTVSANIPVLTQRINLLNQQLKQASERAKNYLAARDTLERLLTECSLERAAQKSLEIIGSQINDIFSRIHAPNEYEYVGHGEILLRTSTTKQKRTLEQVSTGQRAAFALSVFLAMNHSATASPPVILIDDPIAHIDDLNALAFLDYLRDLAVNSNRQIFFATADTRIASLFARKFSFLGQSFKNIPLTRDTVLNTAMTIN